MLQWIQQAAAMGKHCLTADGNQRQKVAGLAFDSGISTDYPNDLILAFDAAGDALFMGIQQVLQECQAVIPPALEVVADDYFRIHLLSKAPGQSQLRIGLVFCAGMPDYGNFSIALQQVFI